MQPHPIAAFRSGNRPRQNPPQSEEGFAIYLKYGGYQHTDDTVTFTIDVSSNETDGGDLYESVHTWSIEGQIQGSDTADVVAKFRALEAAYAVWFQDLVFYDASGAATHRLLNDGSTSGVRIIKPPSYPRGDGAQLSTFRDFSIQAQAVYPASGDQGNVLRSYNETLSFAGGGPERTVVECVNVRPQEQLLKLWTAATVRQAGSAVGLFAYPEIPPPLFPGKERIRSDPPGNPQKGSPQKRGGKYVNYPISWSYEFVSGTPLYGDPNRWPGGG